MRGIKADTAPLLWPDLSDLQASGMPTETASFEIRQSFRSRYARIQILPRRHVRLTVPRGFHPSEVRELILKKTAWLTRVLQDLKQKESVLNPEEEGPFPARLCLRALGENPAITWETVSGSRIRLEETGFGALRIRRGQEVEGAAVTRTLKKWLLLKANRTLPGELNRLARETGLHFRSVSLRSPRTRWGSCSVRRDIMLSSKLLFLPPDLVRYVLVHELSHTVHLDHSRRFWERVAAHEPDWKRCRLLLRSAWQFLPSWL